MTRKDVVQENQESRRDVRRGAGPLAGADLAVSATRGGSAEASTQAPSVAPGRDGERTVTTKDGVRMYYKDWGSGRPVVFHHGWPLSRDDWDAQMLYFLGKGYRVVASGEAPRATPTPSTRRPDGTTDLDAVVVREGKNIKGRLLGFVLGIFGQRVLGGAPAKTVKAIEGGSAGASPAK